MERRAFPRVAAYIASLPAGLDSYPTCKQKGSLLRAWLMGRVQLTQAEDLPPPLRALIQKPPLASSWVSEVHANALYLALCESRFPRDEDFVDFCYRTNLELFSSPLYRALTVLRSPTSFLHAVRIGWGLFRRGTSIAATSTSERSLRLRLSWPPLVMPEVIACGVGTAFRAAVELSGAVSRVDATMVTYSRESAVFDVSWS